MSDDSNNADETTDIIPAQIGLVGRNGEPVKRRSTGSSSDFVTRKEMIVLVTKINTGIGVAANAVGEKMYEQFSEETSEHLERMDHMLSQKIDAAVARVYEEMEGRTLRGRWNRFVKWVMGYGMELGAVEPRDLDSANAWQSVSIEGSADDATSQGLAIEEQSVLCKHLRVTDDNPSLCLDCGVNVSVAVGPRVEVCGRCQKSVETRPIRVSEPQTGTDHVAAEYQNLCWSCAP